jgi:hypothetical protein
MLSKAFSQIGPMHTPAMLKFPPPREMLGHVTGVPEVREKH